MKVIDHFTVKGRGPGVSIDALPAELECGMCVRSGELRWKVVGIETHAMPRSHTNGQPAGLLLRGQTSMPGLGVELEVESPCVCELVECSCTCGVCKDGYCIFCNRFPHGTKEQSETYFRTHPEIARSVRALDPETQAMIDRTLEQPKETMNKKHLPPSAVVLDLILRWAETIGADGTAKVVPDGAPFHERASLLMFVRNHRGEKLSLYTPVHFTGEPSDEQPTRWVLRRLGPGVWKLAPSILSDTIHAFVTVVDVPEPAPWDRQGSHEGGCA